MLRGTEQLQERGRCARAWKGDVRRTSTELHLLLMHLKSLEGHGAGQRQLRSGVAAQR